MKILVVEDNALVGRLLSLQLNRSGHEVRIDSHADTLVEVIQTWKPDAVLLDIMLPGYNAADALTELRQLPSMPHVVLMSALGERAYAKLPTWARQYRMLRKPIQDADLAEALASTATPPAQPSTGAVAATGP